MFITVHGFNFPRLGFPLYLQRLDSFYHICTQMDHNQKVKRICLSVCLLEPKYVDSDKTIDQHNYKFQLSNILNLHKNRNWVFTTILDFLISYGVSH